MKKLIFLSITIFLLVGCEKATNNPIRLPVTLTTDKNSYFIKESVHYQLTPEDDTVFVKQCSDLRIHAVLQRRFNGIWTSLNRLEDSTYVRPVTEIISDSMDLPDSGYFRIMIPCQYSESYDTLYSSPFTVRDTVLHQIGIYTDKISYSLTSEIKIRIVNTTDSLVFFKSCGGHTIVWIKKLNEYNTFVSYWSTVCKGIWALEENVVKPDSLFNERCV